MNSLYQTLNFMWSVDDHDKLSLYNIQIYAEIDVYFCFII